MSEQTFTKIAKVVGDVINGRVTEKPEILAAARDAGGDRLVKHLLFGDRTIVHGWFVLELDRYEEASTAASGAGQPDVAKLQRLIRDYGDARESGDDTDAAWLAIENALAAAPAAAQPIGYITPAALARLQQGAAFGQVICSTANQPENATVAVYVQAPAAAQYLARHSGWKKDREMHEARAWLQPGEALAVVPVGAAAPQAPAAAQAQRETAVNAAREAGITMGRISAYGEHVKPRDEAIERVRALLVEAEGFAAVSPQGQQNIAEAIEILDGIGAAGATGEQP